jgi:large subunit ribosomal protein L9
VTTGRCLGRSPAGTIADELLQQFDVTLDKRKIHLEKPLRTLGDHEVELRLHHDVSGTLKVRVESKNPPEPKPEPAVPAADAQEKWDKGRRRERGMGGRGRS